MTTLLETRFCGCCEAPTSQAPADVWNRPGLSALAYRIGTFGAFRAAMLGEIAAQAELEFLTTRESDDYAITLIELFSAVGDVLTFYNERIANELYLRTARERDSVRRLVRLIGYQLRPGLASTAMLAFALDEHAQTRIKRGLKVMSIPGQDERPQTFEALEEILADARLNALPVYAPLLPFNAFHQGLDEAPLSGRPDVLSIGDRLLFFGLSTLEEKTVEGLAQARDGERVRFAPAVQAAGLWPDVARAVRLTRRLRFFGHNAPDSFQRFNLDPSVHPTKRWETVNAGDAGYQMNFSASARSYPLDSRYDDLRPGAQLVVDSGATGPARLRTAVVVATEDAPESLGLLQDTVTHVTLRHTIRGKPSATTVPGGNRFVVARNGAGAVMGLSPNFAGAQWSWEPAWDVSASDDPSVVHTAALRWDILARDAQGRLRHSIWSAGNWSAFHDWGGVLTSPAVPLVLAGGTLLAFVRGLDFALWVRELAPAVLNWQSLGGVLTSPPAVVSWGGSRIDVFVRGLDRGLWRKARSAGVWSDWEKLEGALAGAPAVASTAANRLDVVALDDAGALIHRRWSGTQWSDWRNLAGKASGEPAIVATGPDRIDVFVRGDDNQLWQIARTGGAWSPWISLGGNLASAPSVVVDVGTLHVYARGVDGSLVSRGWTASGWGQWGAWGEGIGPIAERRAARIFEVTTPDVEFRQYDYPKHIVGGRVLARLGDAPGLQGIDKGRSILLDDGHIRHLAKVTATQPAPASLGGTADHLRIDFEPPVPRAMGVTTLQGNVAQASHGETQPEDVLGNGDATQGFPRFRLSRTPLTYLPSAQDIKGVAQLEIRINGERWSEVPSLYARKPTERVYTARQDADGETAITFGDGRSGARVPSGAMNVKAHYRTGLGLAGRVKAGQLAIPLERPVGLRSVTNPLPAEGGADAETRDAARDAAPSTVRTFGRAVSLEDFAWLAMTSGLVGKAHATWVWQKLEKTVHLTVAGTGGARFSAASMKTLYGALTAARDPNRRLMLSNLVRVPIVVHAKILPAAAFAVDDVLAAARTALTDYFAFAAMPLGHAVYASDIYAALQGATGVQAVDLDLFHLKGHADLSAAERAVRAVTADAVQAHIRIFAARPTPADPALIDRYAKAAFEAGITPPVLAAEQAYLEDPLADLGLTLVEML